jgi:hypothetical protein
MSLIKLEEVGKFQHFGNILETEKLNNTIWQPAVEQLSKSRESFNNSRPGIVG